MAPDGAANFTVCWGIWFVSCDKLGYLYLYCKYFNWYGNSASLCLALVPGLRIRQNVKTSSANQPDKNNDMVCFPITELIFMVNVGRSTIPWILSNPHIMQLFPVNGVNVKRKSSLGICPKWWTRQTPWGLNQPLTRHVASPAAVFMVAFRCFSFMLVKHSSRIFLMIQRDFSPYGVVYCATTVQPLDIDWTTRLYFDHPPRISHSMRLVYSPHAPVAWFADVHLRLFVVTLVYSRVYLIPSISPWPFAGPAKVIEGYAEDSKFEHCRCWSGSWPWVLDALKQWVTRWSWSWRCEN